MPPISIEKIDVAAIHFCHVSVHQFVPGFQVLAAGSVLAALTAPSMALLVDINVVVPVPGFLESSQFVPGFQVLAAGSVLAALISLLIDIHGVVF